MAIKANVRRIVGDIGLGALGLSIGAVVFVLVQAAVGGAGADEQAEPVLVIEAPAAGPGAESPREAVRAFLAAATSGNTVEAFEMLSEADRERIGSAGLWASRRPLGDLLSWEWADQDLLVTTVAIKPGLSQARGWSPAENTITWNVVDEDGWRISFADTTSNATIADASTAVDAAAAWLNDPARCDTVADPQLSLRTPTSAFDGLCSSGGVVDGNESAPVAGRVAAELELSYGPGASTWARSVPLEGGLALILVAIGDRWLTVDAVSL